MRKMILLLSGLAISASLLAAVTEQLLNVKTGLWQVDMTANYGGLPPQMQAMLTGMGGTKTYKTCVDRKQLSTPWIQGDDKCTWTVLKSTSSELDAHGTSCQLGKDLGLSTEEDIKVHAVDPEHVRATVHGTATGNGINATLDGNFTGKWLSETCPADMN